MALGCRKESIDSIMIDNHEVRSTECFKLLGVCIDDNIYFDEHISSISKKSTQWVGVLMRLRNLIPTQTKLLLYKLGSCSPVFNLLSSYMAFLLR